jgi:hypothetical protein
VSASEIWQRLRGRRSRATSVIIAGAVCAGCHYDQYNTPPPPLPAFTIHQLGVLRGGTESAATGGSTEAIVGWATDGSGQRHAVRFSEGQALPLIEPSGASASEAHAVNASGIVVGDATTGGIRRAIVWSAIGATPAALPTLGGTFGIARSINGQGVILGVTQTAGGDTVLVLWQANAGAYTVAPFDSAGVGWRAVGINDVLDVAGNLGAPSSAVDGFYYNSEDGVDTIASPSSGTTVARGLNAYGIVVGTIEASPAPPRAFAFTDAAEAVELGAPPSGYTGIAANAVTDEGIIGGTASTSDSSGAILTSIATITSVTNLSATFTPLPSLGGQRTQVTDNAVTPCGAILGRATTTGTTPLVAVAWVPSGCTIP